MLHSWGSLSKLQFKHQIPLPFVNEFKTKSGSIRECSVFYLGNILQD